ncbi:glycosyltransferase family 25 protein [Photobacterium leiognathi]|uniref:glycosyltransferase family 25 protein n=1 Tax=Photobacterium leiognathi TaxID=553611 RepID=UPI00076A54F1|nr:glycosyltransferase family 25 protein [Photobacterium leiognathi]
MDVNISIISLKKDFEKRELLRTRLGKYDLNPTYIDAVNGKEMTASNYFSLRTCATSKFKGRKYFTPSELGCYLSHKKALEHFLTSEQDWLLVLEDDVDIVSNINNFLKENNFDDNAIYILGGQDGLRSLNRVIRTKVKYSNELYKVRLYTYRWLYRTCCYLISKKVALQILDLMNNTSFMIDDWSFIMKNTQIDSIYYSRVFTHPVDLSNSSIEDERRSCL